MEGLFTKWTHTLVALIPVIAYAGFTEVMSAWGGDWISKDSETDGTDKLIFRQQVVHSSHINICQSRLQNNKDSLIFT